MAGGDFSQEAYEALREAYANELTSQEEAELQGVNVMGQQLSMETLPVDSPWRGEIENWNYPSGKSDYQDGEQKTPEEVLEIMRASAARRDAEEAEEEEPMTEEEVDNLMDSILDDEDDTEDDSEETDDDGEETGEDDAGDEEDEDEEEGEADGEEDGSREEADGPEDEESGSGDEAGEEDEVEEPSEELSPDDIAAEIEALKAELDAMTFNPEEPQDDE